MESIFLTLNEPLVLWALLGAAILLVLIDYLFPVDWLAYVGYIFFAVFIGATIPATPVYSLLAMVIAILVMLLLHLLLFSRFLTNAPRHERPKQQQANDGVRN